MSMKELTIKQLNRRIIFLGTVCVLFTAQILYAVDINPVESAERLDKLGAVGILAFGFILTTVALVYVVRLVMIKGISLIEKSNTISTLMIEAVKHCKDKRDPHNHNKEDYQ